MRLVKHGLAWCIPFLWYVPIIMFLWLGKEYH